MKRAILIPYYDTPQQLEHLLRAIPEEMHKGVLIVDDHSTNPPPLVVGNLIRHNNRKGYGATQKTGFEWALQNGYQQVLLVHGDNQYSFSHILSAAAEDVPIALGSRLLEPSGEMPHWRKFGNLLLTSFANHLFETSYSDLHTGARIYSSQFLVGLPYHEYADGFVFDQQVLAHCLKTGQIIHEFAIPANYSEDVSSISVPRAIQYGFGCIKALLSAKY